MKGYKLSKNDIVNDMIGLNITGNVIPIAWFDHIRKRKGDVYGKDKDGNELTYNNDKVYSDAILLLSDIVYWYRPIEVREESTGNFIGYQKKFKADKLQRSYGSFAEQYGLSKNRVKSALKFLEDKIGVINLELRHIQVGEMKLGNVLFVGLNVDKLKEINVPLCQNFSTGSNKISAHPSNKISAHPMGKFNDTNTETTTETTITENTTDKPGPVEIDTEFAKITSAYENNIGMLTPIMANKLNDAFDEYPTKWILNAIEIAVENEARHWNYCRAILRRWKRDGKDNGYKKQNQDVETKNGIISSEEKEGIQELIDKELA